MIKLTNPTDEVITNWIIKNPSLWSWYLNRAKGEALLPIYETLLSDFEIMLSKKYDRDFTIANNNPQGWLRWALVKYKQKFV